MRYRRTVFFNIILKRQIIAERRAFPEPRAFDRDGGKPEVGQEVRLLTTVLFKGSEGIVCEIGKSKTSIVLDSGNTTTRKAKVQEHYPQASNAKNKECPPQKQDRTVNETRATLVSTRNKTTVMVPANTQGQETSELVISREKCLKLEQL